MVIPPRHARRKLREITVAEMLQRFQSPESRTARLRLESELRSNPHAQEINRSLKTLHGGRSGLVCPGCGEVDHGNKMNGKPFCMKCQIPLTTSEKAKEWKKPIPQKKASRGYELPDRVIVKKG